MVKRRPLWKKHGYPWEVENRIDFADKNRSRRDQVLGNMGWSDRVCRETVETGVYLGSGCKPSAV